MNVHEMLLDEMRQRTPHTAEEIALRLLALRSLNPNPEQLLRLQLGCGGWCNNYEADLPNVFVTSLALIALAGHRRVSERASDRAFRWMSGVRGLESHWLWQWKFRLSDRQVQFDSAKSGWPWIQGTVSWVPPTAAAILAHHSWQRNTERLLNATEMLLDRACPRGGWNAGNSKVFGVDLEPHPDFTAIALLALRRGKEADSEVVQRSLDYLEARLASIKSPYSLAWGALALSAYNHGGATHLQCRLNTTAAEQVHCLSYRNLALAAFALESSRDKFSEIAT